MAEEKKERKATLSFHPSYHSRRFGIDYGQKYHEDPFYRTEQANKCSRALHESFGKYGLGDPEPCANGISAGIQPLDFLNAALGGKMCYSKDESVWTPEKPLEHIESMTDLEKIADINWDNNPVYLDQWRQINEMKEAYPSLQVRTLQGVSYDGEGCYYVMHTPYTTAFRLLGDRIFEIMMLDEELAGGIFEYLMRQYENMWQASCERLGWPPDNKAFLHFGDCAATMLSPSLYEKSCLPFYQKLMEKYKTCTIHSCGPSTHLLDLFAEIPNIKQLQLGAGTDLNGIRKLFPDALISAYYSSPEILNGAPAEIQAKLWQMADILENNFVINGSSVDPDTPHENIIAYLETAQKINEAI